MDGPPAPPGITGHPRRVLFVLVLGTLMASVDSTIVLLAFPTIATELKANLSLVLWTILIYLLVAAILTTQLGRVGDLFGRARMYNLGFAIFIVGSALCGLAPNADTLVAFRGIQAVGGSLLVANSSAIVADNIPGTGRGRAFGYLAMGWSVGATLGIVLGGIITTLVGWRFIFYINVPIGALALYWGVRYLRDHGRVRARLDLVGMGLLAAALTLVTYGATDIADSGMDAFNLSLALVGLALIVPFVLWERRSPSPTLNLRLFRSRLLSRSLGAAFLQSLGYVSIAFLLIMYLQGVRGLSPLDASLVLVPGYVLSSVFAPFMGRLVDRIGPRLPATVGILLMLAVVLIFTQLTVSTPLVFIASVMLISGFGGALFYPANNTAIMGATDSQDYGATSGLMRTLGNAGILGSYVVSITVASLSISRGLAFSVFAGTTALVGGISATFVNAIHSSLYVMAGVLLAAALLSWVRGRPTPRQVSWSGPSATSAEPTPPGTATPRWGAVPPGESVSLSPVGERSPPPPPGS